MSLQTGNNPPTQKGILSKVRIFVQISYRCKFIGPIGDPGGPYACRMESEGEDSFILLAKASRLWTPPEKGVECLSFQKQLILTAKNLKTPLLLCYCPDDFNPYSLTWWLYDPETILENGWDENLRSPDGKKPQTKMWNFPFKLGLQIDEPVDIKENFEILSKRKQRQVRL